MKLVVLYGLITSVFLSFASCKNTDEEFLPDGALPPIPEGYVRMQIIVPGLNPVSTYAFTDANEMNVSTVDVLVFGHSDQKLKCKAAVTEPAKITGSNVKTFDVDLGATDGLTGVDVVVIVNANTEVSAAGYAVGTTTLATVKNLTFNSSGKWPVNGTKPFPMWGETANINLSTNTISGGIALKRSVAKIDVGVNFNGETAQALSPTFVIESVTLYNSLAKGLIAPGSSAILPNTPTAPTPNTNSEFSYAHGTDFTDNLSCTNTIYMAEQEAEPGTGRPFLIVKGNYNGEGSSFYRIDFVDSGGAPQPVLRNHRYKFNITTVKGKGYTDLADAIAAIPFNITTTLTATNAANETLTSYAYDGQYALGVSKDEYILDKASTTNAYKKNNTLKVSATYANYTISVAQTGSWLTMSASATGTIGNTVTDHTFSVTENSGSSDRTATITVTSGRLKKNITVTQKGVAFSVTDPSNPYPAAGGSKSLTVKSPYPWYVKVASDPNAIITYFLPKGTGTGSNETFNFTLVSNTNYIIPEATFTFFSPTGEFQEVSRTVKLQASTTPYPPSTTHKGWAGSNIYWDGTKLTFADTPSSTPASFSAPEIYQGVFFKWGSLIGLDPSYTSQNSTSWGDNCKVYVPSWNEGSSPAWIVKNASTQAVTTDGDDDTGAAVSPATFATWDNIPYVSAGNTTNDQTLFYLTKDADTNLANGTQVLIPSTNGGHIPQPGVDVPVDKMKGDICRYLTQTGDAPGSKTGTRWRMPRANDFSGVTSDYPTNSSRNDWTNVTGSAVNLNNGKYAPLAGRRKTNDVIANYQPWFPSVGYRDSTLDLVGNYGHYWASSPYSDTRAYYLYFINTNVTPANSYLTRTVAFSVRCVKE